MGNNLQLLVVAQKLDISLLQTLPQNSNGCNQFYLKLA
jgi:hypothetical protein